MKRQMFEVLVDPNIKKFGCNFIMTRVSEYTEGVNHPVKTHCCDNNPESIKECLSKILEELASFADKHIPQSFIDRNDKVIVFHRNIGDKKEMFVTFQDHQIGTPVNWLD